MLEEEEIAFTIRIPKSLNDQIEVRRRLHRRSKVKEVIVLLEHGLDYSAMVTKAAFPGRSGD